MSQALPAASPGNAGSPIGTGSRVAHGHEQMQRAEAGEQQDAETILSSDRGPARPANPAHPAPTPTATSLDMEFPEAHPALQHQQATTCSPPALHPDIASQDAAADGNGGVRATLTTVESERLGNTAMVEHIHDQGKTFILFGCCDSCRRGCQFENFRDVELV